MTMLRATDQTAIVIPAYNEGQVIGGVVADVRALGWRQVVVVDDGSSDATAARAEAAGAAVARHRVNRGKGAAVKTGIEVARLLGTALVVTMDGDGQHDPRDIERLIQPIVAQECDVVLGTRPLHYDAMPWYKVLHNKVANGVTWSYSGLWVQDSQSGFRAFSARALAFIDTRSNAYEYDSEVIKEIAAHKLRYVEVPITVRYTDYSQGKIYKQRVSGGIKTAYKMLLHRIL